MQSGAHPLPGQNGEEWIDQPAVCESHCARSDVAISGGESAALGHVVSTLEVLDKLSRVPRVLLEFEKAVQPDARAVLAV